MARYFIDVELRGDLIHDFEGAEFETVRSVTDEAVATAKEMIAIDIMQGLPLSTALDGAVVVHDGGGLTVVTVPFREAAEIPMRPEAMPVRY